MDRVRTRLEKLQRRIVDGRLKAAEKVGAAATRALARNHGHRYYDWAYEDGVFRFFEHPVHFTREQAYEGKYVIQTEEPNLSAVDAVRLYKSHRKSNAPSPTSRMSSNCGHTPRFVRHRSPDGAQIRPRRRYQPRRWHRQALRHDRHKPRRRSAPCPR